jgi:hypothetical protein
MIKDAFLVGGWVAAAIAFYHLSGLSWMQYPATNESAAKVEQQLTMACMLCGTIAAGWAIQCMYWHLRKSRPSDRRRQNASSS